MREDLLQLGPEALALLSNRGLVKRATRMLEGTDGPVVEEDGEGTVVARFPDGVEVRWPVATALADAACSCGSTAICRHRVCAALAYGAAAPQADQIPETPWSPGEFDDEALQTLVGAHALAAARKRMRDGLDAEVHRGSQPRVHLPNGTVRFPVAHAIELVHCDAVGSEREVLIALAVWAAREADALGGEAPVVQVHLQDASVALQTGPIEAIERWVRTALACGIANLPAPAAAQLERARTDVKAAGWIWMAEALADLEGQIQAFRSRDARYSLERAAALLGEVIGRGRATRSPGPPSAGWFVGAGVAPETRLEHLTLTGLGARVRSVGEQVDIDVYLLDPRAGAVLVLGRSYPREAELSVGSRVAGTARLRLDALAAGQLTTQGAIRQANRQLRLAGERGVRKHDLKVGGGAWAGVAPPVRIEGFDGFRTERAERPPAALRPRLRAEDLRVVSLGEIEGIGWRPGARELIASGSLSDGSPLRIRLAHDPAAPGATGALEAALGEGPTHLAGHVRLDGSVLEIEPTAVALPGRVVVPAFAPPCSIRARSIAEPPRDAHGAALESAAAGLAELAHHGLAGIDGRRAGIEQIALRLDRLGLARAGDRLRAVCGPTDRVAAWADAWLTIAVARELPRSG